MTRQVHIVIFPVHAQPHNNEEERMFFPQSPWSSPVPSCTVCTCKIASRLFEVLSIFDIAHVWCPFLWNSDGDSALLVQSAHELFWKLQSFTNALDPLIASLVAAVLAALKQCFFTQANVSTFVCVCVCVCVSKSVSKTHSLQKMITWNDKKTMEIRTLWMILVNDCNFQTKIFESVLRTSWKPTFPC